MGWKSPGAFNNVYEVLKEKSKCNQVHIGKLKIVCQVQNMTEEDEMVVLSKCDDKVKASVPFLGRSKNCEQFLGGP